MQAILHVEDDGNDAALFAMALRRASVNTAFYNVSDARQAVHYLQGDGIYGDRGRYPFPELVLLDWKLPGIDGAEFLKWRNGSRFSELPVVVLTGSKYKRDIQQALDLGVLMVVSKPIGLDELTHVVREICQLELRKPD